MNQRTAILVTVIAVASIALVAFSFMSERPSSPAAITPTPTPTPSPTPSTLPPTPTPTPTPLPTPTPKPITNKAVLQHIALWLNTTRKAASDRLYAYAIYASRTLAVDHPEVYLRGDSIFMSLITSKGGYQKAYQTKDVTDDYFLSATADGPPFSFSDVSFTSYKISSSAQLIPQGYPFLHYLDRRMQTIACTLKTTSGAITQLELAEQFYFKLNETMPAGGRVFIIYCGNENAYVYSGGNLTSMGDLAVATKVEGDPILVFDSGSVWYPLMGRDDTAEDQALQQVVDKYSTGNIMPNLSEPEKEILPYLKTATELSSEQQLALAELAAVHTEGWYGARVYNEYKPYWTKAGMPFTTGYGLWRAMYRVADYLSPVTARLATISNSTDGVTLLTAISKEYTANTATFFYNPNVSWGHSWPCMLCGNTVDETYRSRGSHCVWQAENLAAVLDVIGIDNYVMELGVSINGVIDGSQWHHTVYVPKYDLVLGNGVLETLVYNHPNSIVSYTGQTPRTIVKYLSHGGDWVAPVISGNPKELYYWGTISPNDLVNILKQLEGIHGDVLQGLVVNGNESQAISITELFSDLGSLQSGFRAMTLP